jgi:hypothetical protein
VCFLLKLEKPIPRKCFVGRTAAYRPGHTAKHFPPAGPLEAAPRPFAASEIIDFALVAVYG